MPLYLSSTEKNELGIFEGGLLAIVDTKPELAVPCDQNVILSTFTGEPSSSN